MKETCWSPPTAYRFEKAGKDVQRTGRKESQQLKWGIETQKKLETRDTSIPKTVVWRLLTMKNGEENGNPLQYSCLENPRDGGAWWAAISGVDFGAPKIKSLTVSPSIGYEVMGPDAMILVFWILSFKPTFSLSSFTFIKRLFNSSLLSALRVVSSAYLRLLIFLPAILIPACVSSSPAFLMMYSAIS